MKSVIAALAFVFATYLRQIEQSQLLKSRSKPSLRLPNLSFRKRNLDQEFLAFLWEFKSELSSGMSIANHQVNLPDHRLKPYLETILRIARQTGAPLTPTINRLIKQTKNNIELNNEIAAELASTKATLVVLACLPAVGLVLGTLLSGNSLHWLLNNKFGHICLAAGLFLNLLGIYWLKLIINRALATK